MQIETYRARVMQRDLKKLAFQEMPQKLAQQLDQLIRTVDLSKDFQVQDQAEQSFNALVANQIQDQAETQSQLKLLNHAIDLDRRFSELTSITFPMSLRASLDGVNINQLSSDEDIGLQILFNDMPRYDQYLSSLGLSIRNLDSVQEFFKGKALEFADKGLEGHIDEFLSKPYIEGLEINDPGKFISFLTNLKDQGIKLEAQAQQDLYLTLENTIAWKLLQPFKKALENDDIRFGQDTLSLEGMDELPIDFLGSLKEILDLYDDLGIGLKATSWAYPLLEASEHGYLNDYLVAHEVGLLEHDSPKYHLANLHKGDDAFFFYGRGLDRRKKSFDLIASFDNGQALPFLKLLLEKQYDQINRGIFDLSTQFQGDHKKEMLVLAKEYREFIQNLRNDMGLL